MTPNCRHRGIHQRGVMTRLVIQLLRDDSGVTSTQNFVAIVALTLAAVAASRMIAVVLADLLYRIHVIVTLARP